MRKVDRLATLAVVPLAAGCAVVKHTHIALGVSELSYHDRRFAPADEFRAGFALDAVPTWAFEVSNTTVGHPDATAYFEPKCFTYVDRAKKRTGCYPKIAAWSSAYEVQKRWRPTRAVHPMASATFGRARTANAYADSTRPYLAVKDSMWASSFIAVGGGGELNLASWLHVTLTAGYRGVFRQETLNGTVSPSGFTLTSLLVIGKPYR